MRRLLGLFILLSLCLSTPAWAMEHYINVTQDIQGNAISGVTVKVYLPNTTTFVTIYSDNGVTPKSNPFTSSAAGTFDFYATNGMYDIVLTKTGYTFFSYSHVALFDLTEGGVGGGSPTTFTSITSGTNTSATMVAGSGSSLSATGTGTIAATSSATASALAANGSNCAGNNFALGVDAAGAAECAQPAFSNLSGVATDAQIPNTITVDVATAATALSANGSNCTAGQYPLGTDASGNAESCAFAALQTVNAQTGTTYTIVTGDRGKLLTQSNAGAIGDTLPQAGGTFPSGWYLDVQNTGVGALTITPTTSTIDGAAAVTLNTSQGVRLVSDGTNYFTQRGIGIVAEIDTLGTVLARGKTVTTLTSFANGVNFWNASSTGSTVYTDPTAGPQWVCVIAGVENACDYIRKLAAGKFWEIQNSSAAPILHVDEATGNTTYLKADAEGTGNTITLPFKYNIKPVGCSGTTGTLLLDTNATLAPTATCLAGSTNTTLIQGYADFPDSDGEYQFQDKFRLPADWAGAIDLQIYWKAAATTNAVVWQVQTLCIADAEIEDAAWNTAQAFAADTAQGTTLRLNTVSLTGLTTTGCAAGEMFYIKIYRQRTHASDTITGVVSFSHGELTIRRAM